MDINNSKEIFGKVMKETGKSESELLDLLEKIKEKYQGLLSEVGANIMLAKQFGINLEASHPTSAIVKINDLENITDASLYARVKFIPAPRGYTQKDGTKGRIQAIYVFDETGEIKVNLWNDQADLVHSLKLDKNSKILIKDTYITTYNDKKELSLRQGGMITKDPVDFPVIVPKEENLVDVSNINQTESLIDVIGRITVIYNKNSFKDKDDKDRFVLNFEVSDGIKSLKFVAWDPWPDYILENFGKGDLIKMSDLRVKEGLYDLDINLNWFSTVIKDPVTTKKIPSLTEILALTKSLEEGKIESLEDGRNYSLDGLIVSINRNNLRYFKCKDCNEKVQIINGDFICEKCSKIVDVSVNLFGSVDIDDGTGILKVVFFSELAENVYKLKKENLKKELTEEDKLTIFDKLENELLGKKVKISGRAKLNNFSSRIEFLADSFEVL
jgi:ssDNA-binding replication factor A large subunit